MMEGTEDRSSGGKRMRRQDKDPRPVYRTPGDKLPDREGASPEDHSATPELLNSCNSLNHVRI
jgi:hypothetical protein